MNMNINQYGIYINKILSFGKEKSQHVIVVSNNISNKFSNVVTVINYDFENKAFGDIHTIDKESIKDFICICDEKTKEKCIKRLKEIIL